MQIPPKLLDRAKAALTRVIDRDHDSTVTTGELKKFAKANPVSVMFRFVGEMARGGPKAQATPEAKAMLRSSITRVVDRNHDGFLSSSEAAQAQKDPLKFAMAVRDDLAKNHDC